MRDLSHSTKEAITAKDTNKAYPVLHISVVFTSVAGTLAAFKTAGALASNLGGNITLIVPHIVPYCLALESTSVLLDWDERRFRVIASDSPVETKVHVYLCRDREALLLNVLPPDSLVVIGGIRRWWRRCWEVKLASCLRAHGCQVVLTQL